MAKPRRTTAEAFFDVFADFPIDEQAAALKIMEQIHRLAKRDAGRKAVTMANAEVQIEIQPHLLIDATEHESQNATNADEMRVIREQRLRSVNETKA